MSHDALLALGRRLLAEGRPGDAQTVFEHLAELRPDDVEAGVGLATALSDQGLHLAALDRLGKLRNAGGQPPEALLTAHVEPGVARLNAFLAQGQLEQAEAYAAALVRALPTARMLNLAMACNQRLGRVEATGAYARGLLMLDPADALAHLAAAEACGQAGDEAGAFGHNLAAALSEPGNLHPLIRLKMCHDVASQILARPIDATAHAQLEALLAVGGRIALPSGADAEMRAWAKHYGVLIAAVDLPWIEGSTPPEPAADAVAYSDAAGAPIEPAAVRARADELGAEAVFFAAADEAYVALYARWYVLSVLKYCDTPCLVVVHVIGGAGRLAEIAAAVGVDDLRLVFAADAFDPAAVRTACYDAPPKGRAAKPLAHLQCVRFQRLGPLLSLLERPVFVSDIDLLLQRGIADLLESSSQAEVMFNENRDSLSYGSRITANLVMVRPGPTAQILCRFLRGYFDRVLAGAEVTRWIDQAGLVLARHHLSLRAPDARIGYFDTERDINNVMYKSYQAHPFRFLSLYHGFDTSTLEDPRVLGGAPDEPGKRAKSSRVSGKAAA